MVKVNPWKAGKWVGRPSKEGDAGEEEVTWKGEEWQQQSWSSGDADESWGQWEGPASSAASSAQAGQVTTDKGDYDHPLDGASARPAGKGGKKGKTPTTPRPPTTSPTPKNIIKVPLSKIQSME